MFSVGQVFGTTGIATPPQLSQLDQSEKVFIWTLWFTSFHQLSGVNLNTYSQFLLAIKSYLC
jgi:hypothetical protein